MPTLQTEYITMLGAFARLFSKRIWEHAKILLIGAILSPAERTVTAALRVMGLSGEKAFSELSSGSQSCSLVESGSQSYLVGIIDQCLCQQRSSDPGIGRYD